MSTGVVTRRAVGVRLEGAGRDGRRAERRRLARQDALAARLAELHRMRSLLQEAAVVVGAGWVQNAWFTVLDSRGGHVGLTAHDVVRASQGPVSGACLVGGIVHAAGGLPAVRSQLVQRTLDLTWHVLREDERQPLRWCPPPAVRSAHVRDLTRWNDHPRRTAPEVVSLLGTAAGTADRLRGGLLSAS